MEYIFKDKSGKSPGERKESEGYSVNSSQWATT